ncbi:myelin and lymphocyte protein-like [Synchiropus splendidus]|uniref:myelin and lymphocyte protein-like n=1 Tax=Synchiropus splendidus TaxID=270530 RepID=UPI00237D7D95|nr:myelin and lymphocyte protein-like [Synchiropus splendidus]
MGGGGGGLGEVGSLKADGAGRRISLWAAALRQTHADAASLGTMASTDALPSGGSIFTSIPDLLFIPEFVVGGLVWILVASTRVLFVNPMGWVMFVSVFCFVVTTLWFFFFLCGANKSSLWPSLDAGYHFLATVFYLSASVVLAYITVQVGTTVKALVVVPAELLKNYRLFISAVVMSHVATLLYFLHTIFSAMRWKRA